MFFKSQAKKTIKKFPCLEQVNNQSISQNPKESFKSTKTKQWEPALGNQLINPEPSHVQPITNQILNPCFAPSGMSTEPIIFPNLITGFERNPQYAARAALNTRYTNDDLLGNMKSKFFLADSIRIFSQRLQGDTVQFLYKTDEKATRGQNESKQHIEDRITEVSFWRNELNMAVEKLLSEISSLINSKLKIAKTIENLELILHIAQECIYHREGRQGIEKCKDVVEKALFTEIDNLRNNQKKLFGLSDRVDKQMTDLRASQKALEEDLFHKDETLVIDKIAHQLNDYSRGINYYGSIENYDPHISDGKSWSEASEHRIKNAIFIRNEIKQLRIEIDKVLKDITKSIWDHWLDTNNSFESHISELIEAKTKIQTNLQNVQQEIFNTERMLILLKKAMEDKIKPLKVAQTRLEVRTHREGLELCKDQAYTCLLQEVSDIQETIKDLHDKIQEIEIQIQQLLKLKLNLEIDLRYKVDALFIDKEKCMSLRLSFPIKSIIQQHDPIE